MNTALNRRRLLVVAAAAGLAVAVAGISFAYFTSSGTGTGSSYVGAATNFLVTVSGGTGGTVYPGAGTDNVGFTVTNEGSGYQELRTVTAAIKAAGNGDAQTAGGITLTGCTAAWFSVTLDAGSPALPADLAPNGTYTGSVDVTLTNAAVDQSACALATPGVVISVS